MDTKVSHGKELSFGDGLFLSATELAKDQLPGGIRTRVWAAVAPSTLYVYRNHHMSHGDTHHIYIYPHKKHRAMSSLTNLI